ncbi:MAG TPA: sigma-70 family RNA polymerase sigma factor [Thermoleophilaceae bacterium]|jgi:RNA polymerase sigma factor (sigma-70 family)
MTPKSLLAPARLAGRPVLRSQSDERLVDLVRAGSEPAFEAIVARYRDALLRYCKRILPETRAEDAVQQTFVSAFAALHRDDAHIDLRPWLYRIAHNTSLNALRDRGLGHAELDDQIDGVERPDQAAERRQGLREVLSAVQALPERQRDAMVLRELEGRSYDEIAGTLGVTGGAVRQLLNRARTTLRAGVTAVTPYGIVLRLWNGDGEPSAARIGELVGAGGAGAVATKFAATALVTGALAGGIATVPDRHEHRAAPSDDPAAATTRDDGGGSSSQASGTSGASSSSSSSDASNDRHGGGKSGEDKSDDSSGSGSGDDDGNSGPGGAGSGSGDDGGHSGSGHSGSDDSGSGHGGSGSGHSGEGESGSGSSGSGSSGSGSSGSGSSGSGSSGSSGSGSGGSGRDGGGSGSGMDGGGDDQTLTTESGSGHGGSGSGKDLR